MTQCRVIGIEWPNWEPLNYILFSVYREDIRKLEEENQSLKSDLAYERTMLDNVKAEYESSQDFIKKLKERIRFLEQCLDNKEKVNKSMREEIRKLKEELGKFVMKD